MKKTERALMTALSAVFVAAGVLKIVDPLSFAQSIAQLRAAPAAVLGPVAIVLPWIEVVAAAALWIPRYRRAALNILLGLLAAFCAILSIALVRGTAASCGCFGRDDGFLNRADVALARNAVLLAMALVLILRPTPAPPTSPAEPASPA